MTTTDALVALLEESEVAADDQLGALLTDLRALGEGPVPVPGPELAALLVPEGRSRRRLHRRGAVIGALVVLSLGTGVTAAAASPEVRDGAIGAVAAVVRVLQPSAAAHRAPEQGTTSADRSSASPAPQASTAVRAGAPAGPAVHPSQPGDARSSSHAGAAARGAGRSHGTSGSSGPHDGTGTGHTGTGHGASESGSQHGGGAGSGSDHASGSGSDHAARGGSDGRE